MCVPCEWDTGFREIAVPMIEYRLYNNLATAIEKPYEVWQGKLGREKDASYSKDWPSTSYPLLPARPAIWSSSLCGKLMCPFCALLVVVEITVLLAGIFTPAANVPVAKTTLITPCWYNLSTNDFQAGKHPAWWLATPRRRGPTIFSLIASGCSALQSW